jgi:hypothetical protein
VHALPVLVALGGSDCERLGAGWLAQPVNAVSSLAYVAVGASLLLRAEHPGESRGLLVAAGLAVAGVGAGSVAYHGPQPAWAGLAHNGSIVGLALVIVGHNVWLLAENGPRWAAGFAAPFVVAVPILLATGQERLSLGVLVAAVLAGAVLAHPSAGTKASLRAWKAAGLWTTAALAAYAGGRTTSRLCRPDSLGQLHAVWHVLSALGLGAAIIGFSARSRPVRRHRAAIR